MLLINGQLITGANVRFFGLPAIYQGGGENYLQGYAAMGWDQKAATPNGYGMDGIVPALKDGGLSSYYGLEGAGSLTASMQLGKDLSASLVGSGTVTEASLSLIVSLLSGISGSGSLSASMQGTVQLAASLVGQGDLSAALGLIAWCTASLSGQGSLDGTNLRGTLSMAAEISSTGELVTADTCASAVWARILGGAISAEDALLAAGAAGDPWISVIESGLTAKEVLRIIAAFAVGNSSGHETGNPKFKGLDGTTDRIQGTVDESGNRSGVVINGD
jgi:hypothetical protein